MIQEAEIENYRCFRSAKISDCRTVNVVLGKNASGKTALLEALFLAIGSSPEIALRYRLWRGFELNVVNSAGDQLDRQIWRDLFNGFDLRKKIKISLKGSDSHTRSVEVRYDDTQTFAVTANSVIPTFPSPISFKYHRPAVKNKQRAMDWTVRAQFVGSGFQFSGMEPIPLASAFFSATMNFTNAENVDRFSRISFENGEAEAIGLISQEFAFIDGLQVLTSNNVALLHATSPWFADKRPIGDVSMGVSKYISLVLAISSMKDGVIVIDEIENGFYFDRYESIWSSLIALAKARNVQIFATTHSIECLEALNRAAADAPDDVSFIRTDVEDGAVSISQFHGSTTFDALKAGRDPR